MAVTPVFLSSYESFNRRYHQMEIFTSTETVVCRSLMAIYLIYACNKNRHTVKGNFRAINAIVH